MSSTVPSLIDVAQTVFGKRRHLCNVSVRTGMIFANAVSGIGLKISVKSKVVASDFNLAVKVAKLLAKFTRARPSAANTARDLGILFNPTSRRVVKLQKTRLDAAKRRMKRIAPLAKAVLKARKLTTTGAFPQGMWGQASLALAPTQIKKFRTASAAASGIGGRGRCATTATVAAYGEKFDPDVFISLQQVKLWLDVWPTDSLMRALTTRHWMELHNRVITAAGINWNVVNDPLNGTIATLHRHGWTLHRSYLWTDPTGVSWNLQTLATDFFAKGAFLAAVQRSAVSTIWANASKFWCGEGLQGGVDLDATFALLRKGQNSKADTEIVDDDEESQLLSPMLQKWLQLFLTGGYWPKLGAFEAGITDSSLCPRCKMAPESATHLLYQCAHNLAINDARLRKTDYLCSQAVQGAEDLPCLWLRGFLPTSIIPINTPFPETPDWQFVGQDIPSGEWTSGSYYVDAGGGKYNGVKILRRCGVGIAVLRDDCPAQGPFPNLNDVLKWGAFGSVIGTKQTTPRAELFVISQVVSKSACESEIIIYSDSLINVQAFENGRDACAHAANADIWKLVFRDLDSKRIVLHLNWVKGHCNNESLTRAYGLIPRDLLGNALADALANRGADAAEVSPQDAVDVLWYYSTVRNIQIRAAIILSHTIPQFSVKRTERITPVPRLPSMSQVGRILASQHTFVQNRKALICTTCFQYAPSDSGLASKWLASPCKPDIRMRYLHVTAQGRPTRIPGNRCIRVGYRELHTSHTLFMYRGLYFCGLCGYYAGTHAQKLASPCTSRTDPRAKGRVTRLMSGSLPSGLTAWPNDPIRQQRFAVILDDDADMKDTV